MIDDLRLRDGKQYNKKCQFDTCTDKQCDPIFEELRFYLHRNEMAPHERGFETFINLYIIFIEPNLIDGTIDDDFSPSPVVIGGR